MTLRPDLEQLLTPRGLYAVSLAEKDLRNAALALQNLRLVRGEERASFWLARADELTASAWKRLEGGGD